MDSPSIPDRLEPLGATDNNRRLGSSLDQRRRRSQNPLPRPDQEDEGVSPAEDDDVHNVDELA